MLINIDITGTTAEGKTSIVYLLKEFFEDLSNNCKFTINDGEDKFDEAQWKLYKERFRTVFKDKLLEVNIKTHQAERDIQKQELLDYCYSQKTVYVGDDITKHRMYTNYFEIIISKVKDGSIKTYEQLKECGI